MIQIAEILPPKRNRLWDMVKQCGVDHVVGIMDFGNQPSGTLMIYLGSYSSLERLKRSYEDGGFEFAILESRPLLHRAKLGKPRRED